jgi:hypothetical protein
MYGVSAAFRTAVTASDQLAVVRVTVLYNGQPLGDLLAVSGSVTIDGTRDGALRSLSLTCAPDDNARMWLTALGAEIQVWRGLTIAGDDELVPLGVFVIDADLDEADDGSLAISAADRSQRISRARWTDPYVVAAGADVGTAVGAILTTCWPQCPIGFTTIGKALGAQAIFEAGESSDPWKDARALMASAGFDLYFDGDGYAQYRLAPDPLTATPCATYYDGALAIVVSRTRKASLGQTYNGVIATAEGSGVETPLRGEAWDDVPTSPTYRYGPMGQVPLFYSSPLLTTQADVDSAAATRLARVRGRTEQMAWTLVPNPAHEAFDVIEFVTTATGARARYMIDVVTIPLDNTTMSATARQMQVA